ncbi:Hemicentin-1 [Acropora cervicornis]|uniref:Hemicentin-1 n=1 Tax=Acropora cervicornis TaxID=6130 RepID=A0AAD9QSS8_ACRCE|nr:Hemicentin-1 [Acropora cervicornis]
MWSFPLILFLVFHIHLNTGAGPVFLKMPSFQSKLKGNTLIYECQIDAAQPEYNWFKDGANITKGNISLTNYVSSLTITDLQFSDAGNYTCAATDTQTAQQGSKTGILAVKGKPTIIQPPSVLVAYVGQPGVFHCVAVGDPKPSIQWRNDSDVVTTGGRLEVFVNGTLKIKSLLKSDDSSFFTCEAENLYGSTSAIASLKVKDPPTLPVFTERPANKTETEEGRVTFSCRASGNPFPLITWTKLVGSIPSDRRQEPSPGSLRIINLQLEDEGIYICTAQNLVGNITAKAFLRIEGYPRITARPSNKVVMENSSVQFHCSTEGDPPPSVEWTTPSGVKLRHQSLPSLGSKKVLMNNSLSITTVTKVDAGRYICTARNKIGSRSAEATLTVLAPPRFSSPLQNKTAITGSQFAIDCRAEGVPLPYFQWLFNGSVVAVQQSLHLSVVSPVNQGFYTCIANNSLGLVQGSFYLTVQALPVFTQTPRNQTIPKGRTATFPCTVRGDPTPSIKWYKSNVAVNSGKNVVILSNGTLLVTRVTHLDSGWFTCRAENQAGTIEVKAFLLVADFPVFTSPPSNASVEEGSSVTLSCRAHGPDQPIITWLLDDGSGIAVSIVTGGDVQVDPAGDLKYAKVASKDRGLHICKACNTAGCKTTISPRFPISPAPVYVLSGSTAVLECRPDSSPPATISWTRKGHSLLATGNKYIVQNAQSVDEGMYSCEATNTYGTAKGNVQLSIGTKAVITDFEQTSPEVDKVLIKCSVEGDPSPDVTWYLGNTRLPDKRKYPDYDVTAAASLRVPTAAVVLHVFLCNCSNPLNSVAKLAKVPDSPSQVKITKIMETSLQVSWAPANPLDLVLQYMVEVRHMQGAWKPVLETIQGTSVLPINLHSFTAYQFRVKAKNGLGTSNYSKPSQNVTTLEGATLNGYLHTIRYRIDFTPLNGNKSHDILVSHSSSDSPQSMTLHGLLPDTTYSVRVYAWRTRDDGVERWSGPASKTVKTRQLVPMTPPVDLTAESNGAYQIMVKWKKHKNATAYVQLQIVGMLNTVQLILDLKPNTQYEVKARMYSNAGIGPFSEPLVVKTDVDALAESSKLTSEEQQSGFLVAVINTVIGIFLLFVLIAFACFRQRQSNPSRQSFRIDNLPENPPNRDRTGGNSSSVSTSYDSDGSFEGTYNFAAEDDEIDEQMFAGDRNSTPFGDSRHLYGDPTKLNVAQTTSTEFTEGGGIRLENYKPRVSPLLSPKDGTTVYASVEFNQAQGPSSDFASTKFKGLTGMDIKGSFSEQKEEPPDWVPPPPPIKKDEPQVQNDLEDQRTGPDTVTKDAVEYSAKEPTSSEPPLYAQVDLSKKKNRRTTEESPHSIKNEQPTTNGSLEYDADTSEDDSIAWPSPPPPPPPLKSASPTGDSEWERPLPPEILALQGRRDRMAIFLVPKFWLMEKTTNCMDNKSN